MEFEDDAFVLSARAHGESGAIVEFLTASHGKYAAHVAGGASRRLRPLLLPGARVSLRFRARVSDQLGAATIEPVGEGPSALFDDALALAGTATPRAYIKDGEPRASLDVTAQQVLTAYHVTRKRNAIQPERAAPERDRRFDAWEAGQ